MWESTTIVSLSDMVEELDIRNFVYNLKLISLMSVQVQACSTLEESKAKERLLNIKNILIKIRNYFISLGIPNIDEEFNFVLQLIGEAIQNLDTDKLDSINRNLQTVDSIVLHELQTLNYYVLSRDARRYLDEKVLIEKFENNKIFKKAKYHLIESSKCIAFARYTASVFHSLCALDCTLDKLIRLTKKYTGAVIKKDLLDKSWGIVNSRLKSVMDAAVTSRQTSPAQRKAKNLKKIGELRAYMTDIQMAKRDETMHAKGKYNEEEAVGVFDNTCRLIDYLDSLK